MAVADTIRELAEKVVVDPVALEERVDRYNQHAKDGQDPD
jgi:hypothetical protein